MDREPGAQTVEAEAVVEEVVVIVVVPAVAGVYANIEACPGEHRNRHVRSGSHNAARQVGRGSAHGEPQQGD